MKVIYGIGKAEKVYKQAVLAIGVFDGVHLGHKALITKSVEKAKKRNGQAIVMTFAQHPVKVLRPEIYLSYITYIPHRIHLIESLGVNACIIVHFTKRFADLTPENFIKRYLVDHIRPKEILVGQEFRFGRNRGGTIEIFNEAGKKFGFTVDPIKSIEGAYGKIGSTAIRKMIAAGNISEAGRNLGRFVSIFSKVIKGDGRGRKLGFPTANIMLNDEVLPPLGVYATLVTFNHRRFKAMANIGHRPSFKRNKSPITLEVHIFNFNHDLCGKDILVEFVEKIREEKKFQDKSFLIAQLEKDAILSNQILSNY